MPTIVTPRKIVEGALRKLGVVGSGATMSGEDAKDGFVVLNDMVDAMKTERLLIFQTPRTVISLTAGTASYTIGIGGDINIDRPLFLDEAGIIIDDTVADPTERPITVFRSDEEWAAVPHKARTSDFVQAVYFDRSWSAGLGRLYVTPIPTVNTTDLVLYVPVPLQEFTSLTTEYTLPPGYRKMLKALLAVDLAADYGMTPPGSVAAEAARARAYIKRVNMQFPTMSMDPALPGMRRRRFRIEDGEFQ